MVTNSHRIWILAIKHCVCVCFIGFHDSLIYPLLLSWDPPLSPFLSLRFSIVNIKLNPLFLFDPLLLGSLVFSMASMSRFVLKDCKLQPFDALYGPSSCSLARRIHTRVGMLDFCFFTIFCFLGACCMIIGEMGRFYLCFLSAVSGVSRTFFIC